MFDFMSRIRGFKSFKHFAQYSYNINSIFIDSYLGKTVRYLPLNNTHSILLNFYLLHNDFYETPICQITPSLYDLMCEDNLGQAILKKLSKINSNQKIIPLQLELYKYKSDIFLRSYYDLVKKPGYQNIFNFFINKTYEMVLLINKAFVQASENKEADAFTYFLRSKSSSYSKRINNISKSIIDFAISRDYKYEKLVPIIMYYLYKNPKRAEYEMEDKYHFLNSILLSEYYINYALYNSDIYYDKENNTIFLAPKSNAYIFLLDTEKYEFYKVLSQKSLDILSEILERLPKEIEPKFVKIENIHKPFSFHGVATEEEEFFEEITNEEKLNKILEQDVFVMDINAISIFEYSFTKKDTLPIYNLSDYIETVKKIEL